MRSGYWLLTIVCVGPDIVNFIFHLYTFNCCSKERESKNYRHIVTDTKPCCTVLTVP